MTSEIRFLHESIKIFIFITKISTIHFNIFKESSAKLVAISAIATVSKVATTATFCTFRKVATIATTTKKL